MNQRGKLLNLLVSKALKIGEFSLVSGLKTGYYIDLKQVSFDPLGFRLLGRLLYEEVKKSAVDSCGGVESGGIPLVSAVISHSFKRVESYRGFFVRREARKHGLKQWIVGCFQSEDKVIVLEDVITTGNSAYAACRKIEECDGRIVKILTVVNREEPMIQPLVEGEYEVTSLFSLSELVRAYQDIAPDRVSALEKKEDPNKIEDSAHRGKEQDTNQKDT